MVRLVLYRVILFFALALAPLEAAPPHVVINEIHFNPPDKRPLEFVELLNSTPVPTSLAGWALGKFTFPTNAVLAPGGLAVVAQDPEAFAREFGFTPFGPLSGKLSNHGEHLSLRDAQGSVVDEVRYGVGFPWPTAAAGGGSSLERVHPDLPSNDPASWRSSGFPDAPPTAIGTVFVAAEDTRWRWRKGTNEASNPTSAWRRNEFIEDASWQSGQTSIGYGDDDDRTLLTDMQGQYTSLFLRHSFVVRAPLPQALLLRVRVDDGCIVWINGTEVKRFHMRAGEIPFNGLGQSHEAGQSFEDALLPAAARWLAPGTNVLAIQVFNASKNSSDLTIDAELRTPEGAPGKPRPTPGATNSVYAIQPPVGLTEVAHAPLQPKANELVTVTARVSPPARAREVTLQLQAVEPGKYLRRNDAAYEAQWTSLPMRDDGQGGDAKAKDGIYTALVPPEWQRHRRLLRYRVVVVNESGARTRAPWPDDSCPNFAWFVYDGVPAWTGASRPGTSPPTTFPAAFLETLPIYHLLAQASDVARSQWDGGANRVRFQGTLVYDGRVYDHIQFHNRGSGSAYISGKNKWGFKFNREHPLPARDIRGRRYEHPWDSLNLNPGLSTPYLPVHCGIAGLDEAVTFRAFQLAGVPAANTHWVHFRVIDGNAESSPTDQYAGDLHGLYLAVQDMDGTWLRERGLPDGNVYSMQSGRKHLARGAVADGTDWSTFLDGVRQEHGEGWWRAHLDLAAYYSFHAINRVIGNVDLRPDGNHGYYRRPTGQWAPFPWDHDMVLVPRTHQPGYIDAIRCLNVPSLKMEFQNRAREVLDLFCSDASPSGGQAGQLVAELARALLPHGFTNDWGRLDEAVWNWNPHQNQKGIFYVNPSFGQHFGGSWERTLATPDLNGFCRYIVEFCTDSRKAKNYAPNDGDQHGYGFGFLQAEARDDAIPVTPVLRSTASPAAAAGALEFETSPFQHPRGTNLFAAVQWRVAEIRAPGLPGFVAGEPWRYELEPLWTSEELRLPGRFLRVPAAVCQPRRTYRVRARYRDATGRWSHWSGAIQFVPEG